MKASEFKTLYFVAPAYWATYLICNDDSGIPDEELPLINAWLEWIGCGSPVDCTEIGFGDADIFGVLPGDLCEYAFLEKVSK